MAHIGAVAWKSNLHFYGMKQEIESRNEKEKS